MPPTSPDPDFDTVVAEAGALQHQLPWLRLVCVGGTAAALHAHHRYSTDSDHVGETVAARFDELRVALTGWEGWKTKRIRHPYAILGERHGVRLGVRQQRRRLPFDVTRVGDVWVPTAEETLRIKAWMVADRGAMRDYLDVAALSDALGERATLSALRPLSRLYAPVGTETATMRFAQAAMRQPVDVDEVDLAQYRGLVPRYQDVDYVLRRVREVALPALEQDLVAADDTSSPTAPPVPEIEGREWQADREDERGPRS